MKKIVYAINSLLKFILPVRCVSCDITLLDDAGFCQICWNKIHFISGAVCQRCGYPMEFDLRDDSECVLCGRCINQNVKYYFEYARSICSYNKIIGFAVSRLKYNDNLHIANFIAKSLVPCFLQNFKDCNIICPVPMHAKFLRKRTFNQSALIASLLTKMLKKQMVDVMYIHDLIIKNKITKRQNKLLRQQRLENVKNGFIFNKKYNLENKNILILDDVITTGATINECAKAIKKDTRSNKVYAISYARTTLYDISNDDNEI